MCLPINDFLQLIALGTNIGSSYDLVFALKIIVRGAHLTCVGLNGLFGY